MIPSEWQERLSLLPERPGVYRFLDRRGEVLYVGKAKSLKKRVSSYFTGSGQTPKTMAMLTLAVELATTITESEGDALVLEANLIKQLKPRFNVLLKDDKSYPYLHLSTQHPFPRLTLYRGDRSEPGRYFGPYPSTSAVRETLHWLQRIFPIRQCADNQFDQQQRPCLQHQIKRCGAPCGQRIGQEAYAALVRELVLFLEGRDRELVKEVRQAMWAAAASRAFESATTLRDRLKALEYVQEQRRLNLTGTGNLDGVAMAREGGVVAVQLFMVRGGLNLGNKTFFPEHTELAGDDELLAAFLGQFYAAHPPPAELLLDRELPEQEELAALIGERWGCRVEIHHPRRGEKRRLVELATTNAGEALRQRLQGQASHRRLLEELAALLGLPEPPRRIEAYDISHIQGSEPVGSLVVFTPEGFQKGAYRKFACKDPTLADDTARMAEVLTRRFQRLREEAGGEAGEGGEGEGGADPWPDLVLLDGGVGQLGAVLAVMAELGISGVPIVAMAKGPERNAGRERLFLPDRAEPLILPEHSPLLFLLQRIRDEAHRFAVGFHRQRRGKSQTESLLDRIEGVGPQRKKALLRHFGSIKALMGASEAELAGVAGVSASLARRIHRFLHETV